MHRPEAIERIKAGLKNLTGKNWSVTGGRGTAWGWITIQALPRNRVNHKAIPETIDNFDLPLRERVIEVTPKRDKRGYYTSFSDCELLATALGLDYVHYQGISFDYKSYGFYVDRAENGYTEPEIEEEQEWVYQEIVDPPVISKSQVEEISQSVINANIEAKSFTKAKMPHLNKNCWLSEYTSQLPNEEYSVVDCVVESVVTMTKEQYQAFTEGNLMTGFSFLSEKGGCGSSAIGLPPNEDLYTIEDWKKHRKHAFIYVVAIKTPGYQTLFVDPQGYNYARYVGFPVEEPPTTTEKPLAQTENSQVTTGEFDIEIEEYDAGESVPDLTTSKPNPMVELAKDFLAAGKTHCEVLSLLLTQLNPREAVNTLAAAIN